MSYTHLTEEERYHIDELLGHNFTQSAIAQALGRSASTLSRELRRNKGKRGWRPRQAGLKATERLSDRGRNNVSRVVSETAWEFALDKLDIKEFQSTIDCLLN